MHLTNRSAIPCIEDSVIIVRARSQSTWASLPSSTIVSSQLLAVHTRQDEKSSPEIVAPRTKPLAPELPGCALENEAPHRSRRCQRDHRRTGP